ncbi:MAG: sugar phosphate isomerase/epimerase [Desulfobacteraceae bacterium]|jgi:sugar phosphate isomerase/epimerase
MTNDDLGIHLGGTARAPKDVENLHELGLQFAEIPVTNPRAFTAHIKAYKRLKDDLGLYYLCHGPREGDPNDTEALERKYFPKVTEILADMKQLEMSILTIHLWLDPRFVREEAIAFKIDLLRRIIKRAVDACIMVCLENLSERASDLEMPFKELPSLYMTLDLGHAQLLTTENRSYGFIKLYPERIKHIHMHDNKGGSSYLDDIHLPPGEGIVDFKEILGNLKEIGYSRTITLELSPTEIEGCLGYVKRLFS